MNKLGKDIQDAWHRAWREAAGLEGALTLPTKEERNCECKPTLQGCLRPKCPRMRT